MVKYPVVSNTAAPPTPIATAAPTLRPSSSAENCSTPRSSMASGPVSRVSSAAGVVAAVVPPPCCGGVAPVPAVADGGFGDVGSDRKSKSQQIK